MIYFELFICYLKIGFFGFGGGYSMLSLIHHEVVTNHGWISSAALNDIIAISQMTPGPIAINSATYIGYTVAGFWGSVIATAAVCLPSLSIMVLITRFFLKLKDNRMMDRVMTAMRPAVIGMIGAASMLLIFPADCEGASMIDGCSWLLFAVAFVASMRRVNPIKLIVLSAVAGIAIYYIPTLWGEDSSSTTLEQRVAEQWKDFDMTRSETISTGEFEQAWVDYIYTLQSHNPLWAAKQLKASFDLSAGDAEALNALFDLSEKYLYNPNSMMRNDELFIPALEYMIDSPAISEDLKMRPEALLAIAQLNRVGQVANDFHIEEGKMMHQVQAPYTLLYFNDPDCEDCKRTSSVIERSEVLTSLQQQGELVIVSLLTTENMEVDSLYDLKAIPTLYLLDESKRVLLKDPTIERVIESLSIIYNNRK